MFAPVPAAPSPPFSHGVSSPVTPPVADFSGTPLTGTAPLTVQFTDLSTNTPTSWAWTFGDGDTSTSQNPSHDYAAAGTYTVGLTATNAGGSDLDTKTDYITVTAAPVADTTDTHDGFDEHSHRRVKESQAAKDRAFKSTRERLREVLERAWDGPQTEAAAEVKQIASPFVEILESGKLRIDYAALAAQEDQLLSFHAELRREYEKRIEDEDEENVEFLALWSH